MENLSNSLGDSGSVLEQFKEKLIALDIVAWSEAHLFLDGKPFRLNGNGYRPFKDIYRYIAIEALKPDAKKIIIKKSRQVGLTTTASVVTAYFCCSGMFGANGKPPMRIMHVFPTLDQATSYSKTKLSSILNSSYPAVKNKSYCISKLDSSSPSNDSALFKQFIGSNHVFLESMGIDANRLRGKTCDILLVDECQMISDSGINNGTKILIKSNYGKQGDGIQLYFGTPLQKGSSFQRRWEVSNQQYFYLHCEECKDYFPLYTGNDTWEKIWIKEFTVECTKCGCQQDKRIAAESGKWVAHGETDSDYMGFCINQLYMPEFTKEMILAQKPENHPSMTERAYRNEVLGEFYSSAEESISIDEIEKKCTDIDRHMSYGISASSNKKVYAGFDWGSKDADETTKGKSYSCAVIISTDGPHIVNVEYATRLMRNDLDYKVQFVDELFRKFKIDLAVGDLGYANDLSGVIAKRHPDKFIVSRACAGGGLRGFYKFDPDAFPREIKFDKDNLIHEVYAMLRKGLIKLPYKDRDRIFWLVEHFVATEIKHSLDRAGEVKSFFVKNGPNDGLMSFANALLALKYEQTNGFSIKNPNDMRQDVNKREEIPLVMAYAPGFRHF